MYLQTSPESLKQQAKRLREYLQNRNMDLSHSAALEAVSQMHGYKDWNTATAAASGTQKLFYVTCGFEERNDDDRFATFEFFVRANSYQEAIALWKKATQDVPYKAAFAPGTELWIETIYEISDLHADGIILNTSDLRFEANGYRRTINSNPDTTRARGVRHYDFMEDAKDPQFSPDQVTVQL